MLTAAHCLDHDHTNEIEVRLGEHDRKVSYETEAFITKAKISSYRLHPGYKNLLAIENKGYVENDIASLELETPVDFTAYPHIRPACLPGAEDIDQDYPQGQVGTVVGWGFTRHGSSEHRVTFISQSVCQAVIPNVSYFMVVSTNLQ